MVQDESAGIWINVNQAFEASLWQGAAEDLAAIEVGSEIEIDGVIDRGTLRPGIGRRCRLPDRKARGRVAETLFLHADAVEKA